MLTAASRPLSEIPRRMVLMGVAGCGKSSVGAALATRLGATYSDGDDLHPPANIEKMSRGVALNDDDRWPWLTLVGQALAEGEGRRIIGCSALKRVYRAHITQTTGGSVTFHLAGTPEMIKARMSARQGHFMPTGLLASQFAAPKPNENAISVDIDRPLAAIVGAISIKCRRRGDGRRHRNPARRNRERTHGLRPGQGQGARACGQGRKRPQRARQRRPPYRTVDPEPQFCPDRQAGGFRHRRCRRRRQAWNAHHRHVLHRSGSDKSAGGRCGGEGSALGRQPPLRRRTQGIGRTAHSYGRWQRTGCRRRAPRAPTCLLELYPHGTSGRRPDHKADQPGSLRAKLSRRCRGNTTGTRRRRGCCKYPAGIERRAGRQRHPAGIHAALRRQGLPAHRPHRQHGQGPGRRAGSRAAAPTRDATDRDLRRSASDAYRPPVWAARIRQH